VQESGTFQAFEITLSIFLSGIRSVSTFSFQRLLYGTDKHCTGTLKVENFSFLGREPEIGIENP
jgi:hypothetical protein